MQKCIICAGICALMAASSVGSEEKLTKGPEEDGTKPALIRIAGEGVADSHAFDYLTELSDEIGARVTGTPAEHKAEAWGVGKMKAIGLENVHTEKYQIWRGWSRGTTEAEIISPVRHRLTADAMGWTGSTAANGTEADVVTVNMNDLSNEIKNVSRLSGKIALVVSKGKREKGGVSSFAQFGDFLKEASKAGVIAVIGGQGGRKSAGMHLTHTGILGFAADFAIPVISVTGGDQGQVERFLEAGKKVRLRVNVQNTFTNGPAETANVVGEIRGREHPQEIFVVGAHLDSWDLSEGATDNGSGSVCVLGAAEAILKSGQRPRRTIRFVLFTGEEQGLLGSAAYVEQHKSEMANHLGDLVLDEGQGPVKEYQLGGRADITAAFEPFAAWVRSIREIKVVEDVEFGTDTGPFILAGLPGINMNQDSPEYKFTHHSSADALEAVKPDVLTQNATLMALTAYWIADRPERLALPWPNERSARMLRDKGEYETLKAFNLWPFGSLGAVN